MRARLVDLVKRLGVAADRRRGMDGALLYGLDAFDLDLLLSAAASDLDANIGLAYRILRGGTGPARPSTGLALELAGISSMSGQASARLGASGELRRDALLDVSGTQPWLARELSCPDRVIAHLQGTNIP